MKKSYVLESSLNVYVTIDLGEINDLISELEPLASEESNSNWKARDLVKKLKTMRKEAAEEASREFARMAEK
jgi:hypothetical protein